jgi:hypothetical protein
MAHEDRIQHSITNFRTAMDAIIATLERLSDEAAARKPADGGWSAAQIGAHVAISNDLLAGAVTGTVPMARAVPADFVENPNVWSNVPSKVRTFPQLDPPPSPTRTEAIASLRASIPRVITAIEGMSEERAGTHCVTFPFGDLSMYQFADFVGGHVTRHDGQIQRATAAV